MQSDVSPDSKHVSDHLANERTYLAWIRTGVSMMGLGIVIAKLRYLLGQNYSETTGIMHAAQIGLWLSATGVITIIMSVFFFLQTQKEIRNSNYRSRKFWVMALAVLTGGLGFGILWYLMQPTEPVTVSPGVIMQQR